MNHTERKLPSRARSGLVRAGIAALALPVLATVARAQAEAAPAAPAPEAAKSEEEIVKLSPFSVETSKDSGYKASNSVAGTRSNTPIKEIPLNIQVFTKELAQDLNLTNQIDLERYNAALVNGGSDARSSNPIQQAYNAFLFRGFVQNWGLRDGIRQYDPIDMQGLERVELVKGPAAPLYGLTYPGGVMNSISKEASFQKNFVDLTASMASYGEYRGTVDANASAKVGEGRVAIRYNGAFAETNDDRDHSEGNIKFQQLNLSWRPLEGTELKFMAENGYRNKPNGLGYFSRGDGQGTGADIPLQIVHPEIPWSWNWATGHDRSADTSLYRGVITQKIGQDLVVTAYAQTSAREQIDSNGWDASGGGGSAASWDMGWSSQGGFGSGWMTLPNGQEIIRNGYHYRDWCNTMKSYGLTALYKLDFDALKNTFTAGAAAWSEQFQTHKWTQPGTTTNFWDYPVKAGINLQAPKFPPSDYFADLSQWSHEDNSNDYYFASWQGKTLNDRLHLTASVNKTNLKLVQWGDGYPNTTPKTTEADDVSPMYGATFDITKEISVFAVYSTSLFPTTDKNSFSVQMPPVTGESYEGGVKIDLFNGKLSGTISAYQITQEGGSQNDPTANNLNTQRWDSMTPEQRAVAFPGQTRADIDGDLVPGGKQESKGIEADIIWQPTQSLQFMFSYAHNDTKVVSAINASTIGQSPTGHIADQWALVSKYSFMDGSLKGLFVGAGLQSADKALQGYQTISKADAGTSADITTARYNPSTFYAEVFSGYRFKAFGFNQFVQLNLKNITQQDEFTGWKPSGSKAVVSTERYHVSTPMTWSVTYGVSF